MADDRDDDPDLSDREKELRKWNQPYVHQEFPKMLYRGTTTSGVVSREDRVVGSAVEEQQAVADGWHANPKEAIEAETRRQEAIAAARQEQEDRKLEARLHRVLDEREERQKRPARHPTALADNIDRYRMECGWSIEKLAAQVKITRSLVKRHLNGFGANPDTLKKYADAFTAALGRPITTRDLLTPAKL